jgi:hypothetical protein
MKRPLIASPPWTIAEDQKLRDLAVSGARPADIAKTLGRSEAVTDFTNSGYRWAGQSTKSAKK